MFMMSVVLAIIIGYIGKGRIRNLEHAEIKGIHLVTAAFLVDITLNIMIKLNVLYRGSLTFIVYFAMYCLLFWFIYMNRKSVYILMVGFGFLLNAIVIFSNGGAMPCGIRAMKAVGLNVDVAQKGLYVLVDEGTRFWFLGDVIPFSFISKQIVSIGDIVLAIGLMLFIITEMRKSNHIYGEMKDSVI
jgi:hypothetical protein